MGKYFRSDLAGECFGREGELPRGAHSRQEQFGSITVHRLQILGESAARELQRPVGCYVGIHTGRLHLLSAEEEERTVHLLAGELSGMAYRLTKKARDSDFSVLAVGLGNRELTADAIGPQTAARLHATRHLAHEERDLYLSLGCCSLTVLTPGVLGQTGMEATELIRGAIDAVKPDLLVVIDALAAKSRERLAATVQLSDTGIVPGSGVGNHRAGLSRETLGVPVIAIGVPTVIHTESLLGDLLSGIGDADARIAARLKEEAGFFVTPKDGDCVTRAAARILSRAICLAFTEQLSEIVD